MSVALFVTFSYSVGVLIVKFVLLNGDQALALGVKSKNCAGVKVFAKLNNARVVAKYFWCFSFFAFLLLLL